MYFMILYERIGNCVYVVIDLGVSGNVDFNTKLRNNLLTRFSGGNKLLL